MDKCARARARTHTHTLREPKNECADRVQEEEEEEMRPIKQYRATTSWCPTAPTSKETPPP